MEHRHVAADPAQALLRIRDLQGRLCGLGFVADRQGTVVTAYETVAGLPRVVLHTPGGQTRVLGPDSIDLLPGYGLALLRTDTVGGVPGPALPVAVDRGEARLVAVPHQRWEDGAPALVQGGVLGRATALYPGDEGRPVVEGVLVLELPGVTPPAGAPVLDAETGAVLGVVAPGLTGGRAGTVQAVPLHRPSTGGRGAGERPDAGAQDAGARDDSARDAGARDDSARDDGSRDGSGPLAALLARNAEAVPAHGRALNLGGLLQLAAVQLGAAMAGPGRIVDLAADRVDRSDGLSGEEPQRTLTVLLGEAGSGRTTELAALTVRRAGGARPLPTLWLRGADLAPADRSLADTVGRALARAAARLGVPAPGPDRAAALCAAAGRPLLVVLDGPEEAPLALGGPWQRASAQWLRNGRARLLVACRTDGWEGLREWWDGARLHWLDELPEDAAGRAARRYGLPEGYLADRRITGTAAQPAAVGPAGENGRHPLALRFAGELWAEGVRGPVGGRSELFEARLDLCCLRIARRVAAAGAGPRKPGAHRRGGPVPAVTENAGQLRRLAAAAAGRVHEAARLMLGAGHGGLAGAEFAALFPAAGGWGRAALDEGLFVPAGEGYRLAHEEWADWLQGLHLDLDGALRLLLAEDPAAATGDGEEGGPRQQGGGSTGGAAAGGLHGVACGRVGVVVAALRRVAEARGAGALDVWLHRIRQALDASEPGGEVDWWAGRLLAELLPLSPEPAVHRVLLELLAERAGHDPRFGPPFWARLPLTPAERLALLRRLVRTDGGPGGPYRTATAELLTADPAAVQPLLCGWFDDPDEQVADLAADLLHTHRALALDELTEALVGAAHPRADRLLDRLATEEPSALCRAVDRWSHDPRPERHVAAAVHALRTAPYATASGGGLLRHAARTMLAREDEPGLHGAALALLLGDAETRAEHLPAALAAYRADDRFLTATVLAGVLAEHPREVLTALRDRLAEPGAPLAEGLRLLAGAADPDVVRRGTRIAAELLHDHPERAEPIAEHLDALLARGHDARPLLAEALTGTAAVRRAFARVLTAPDPGPVRGRLLDTLLAAERDPAVLGAVLERLVEHRAGHRPARLHELLRRITARWDGADPDLVRTLAAHGRDPRCAVVDAAHPELRAEPRAEARVEEDSGTRVEADGGFQADSDSELPAESRADGRLTGHTGAIPVPRQGRAHGTL